MPRYGGVPLCLGIITVMLVVCLRDGIRVDRARHLFYKRIDAVKTFFINELKFRESSCFNNT